MTSIPKSKNVARRSNGVVAEAPPNSTENSLLTNQQLEFSPEVAALMASYQGPLVTIDSTSERQAEIKSSGDHLLAESHSHLSPTSSNSKAQNDRLDSSKPLLESIELIRTQLSDTADASKTVETPSPIDSSAALKKVDSAPSVDTIPSYWAYNGSSFNSSSRPSSSSVMVSSDPVIEPIPCGPLNAWYLCKGGIPNFSKQMSQVARTSNQQPLAAAAVAAAAVAVAASQIFDMPSSSSENRNADRPALPRRLKKKAPDECLRDDEESESSHEIMKLLEKSATRLDPAVELELEENHKPEGLTVSTAQRKRPRLAVELDSERKQSRSLELSLLQALLQPKPK